MAVICGTSYGKLTAEQIVSLPQTSLDLLSMTFGKEPSVILSEAHFEIKKVALAVQVEKVTSVASSANGQPSKLEEAIATIIPDTDQIDWSEIGFDCGISISEGGEIIITNANAFLRREASTTRKISVARSKGNGDVATLPGTSLTAGQIAEIGSKAGYTLGWIKTPRITASAILTKAGHPVKRGASDEEVAVAFCKLFNIQGS